MIMSLKLPEPANKITVRRGLTFGFLLISVFLLTLTATTVQPVSLAQAQRDRRIATEPTATPIPSPATSLVVSRPVAASRNAPATLTELKTRLAEIAHQPALDPGFF